MKFQQACQEAIRQAIANPGCTIHVNAVMDAEPGGYPDEPKISHYVVTGWYSVGQTVRSVVMDGDGEPHDLEERWLPVNQS